MGKLCSRCSLSTIQQVPGLLESHIFHVFSSNDFRCIFKIVLFCFFLIFSDLGSPSGACLVPFWGAKEAKKGTLFLKGSQEGPWEGFGSDFKWVWEVFWMYFCTCFQ